MKWYRAACPVCRGDLYDDLEDEGWVTCFSCSRSFEATKLGIGARAQTGTSVAGRSGSADITAEGVMQRRASRRDGDAA